MNILHYSVGLNKYRGGGLTKYVDDLVKYQSNKNRVIFLYPGRFKILDKEVSIKKEQNAGDFLIYSIVNPLGLPMMFGLKDFDYLYKKSSEEVWLKFLISNSVDIIHIHSFMGLYEEFIDAANKLSIPIVYTTHDYFGLCPKQTYIYKNEICKNRNNCVDCPDCNRYAFSKFNIFIIHSKVFTFLRKNKLFLKIKGKEKMKLDQINGSVDNVQASNLNYYRDLKIRYKKIFDKIDWFHFNSTISEYVFRRENNSINGDVINISHNDITDNREYKDFSSDKLRFTYLGPATVTKGFNFLIDVMDKVYIDQKNFVLNIYTYIDIDRDYIIKNETSYNYSELGKIMNNSDIVVAPSKWFETFGFTIKESLSYGVPVIVSETLGAKDLVKNGENGFIINNTNFEFILRKVINNREILKLMNKNIVESDFESFDKHCIKIEKLYKKIIKEKRH